MTCRGTSFAAYVTVIGVQLVRRLVLVVASANARDLVVAQLCCCSPWRLQTRGAMGFGWLSYVEACGHAHRWTVVGAGVLAGHALS